MKIVLREHVDHLGSRGDVVSVAPGYARNYLLPKGLALRATPGNLKVLDQQRRVWEVKEAREVEQARAVAQRLEQLQLAVTRKAGESGTLYGSVTTSDVAELLGAQGVEIDRRRIVLHEPIKSIGTHAVTIKLHRDVSASVTVEVSGEHGSPALPVGAAIDERLPGSPASEPADGEPDETFGE